MTSSVAQVVSALRVAMDTFTFAGITTGSNISKVPKLATNIGGG